MPQLWLVSLPKVKGKAELSNNIERECPVAINLNRQNERNLHFRPIIYKPVKSSNKIYERGIFKKVGINRKPIEWYEYNPAMFTKVNAGIFENPPFDEEPFICIMRN